MILDESVPLSSTPMSSLAAVLDRLDAECELSARRYQEEKGGSGDDRTMQVARMHEVLGSRSFGPILVVAGLFCITPVGVVPGVPTLLAILVLTVSLQQVAGRDSLWLPRFLLDRRVSTRKVARSVEILRHVAGPVDRIFTARMTWLVEGGGARAVGGVTAVMAVLIPPLEFVPFSVTIPAVAIAGFGLGILTRDGLLLLVTAIFVIVAMTLVARQVLF